MTSIFTNYIIVSTDNLKVKCVNFRHLWQ